MTDRQREELRRLRGAMSVRAFHQYLIDNGLSEGELSRQRLSKVEQGHGDLPAVLWDSIADALIAGGRTEADVAYLRPVQAAEQIIESVPPSTPVLRRRQWTAVAVQIPGSRWWRHLGGLLERLDATNLVRDYGRLLKEYEIDPAQQLAEVERRLRLSPSGGGPEPGDAVSVEGDPVERSLVLRSGELFILRLTLRNAGTVAWRDRFLYRIGPPVTSSLPFAITLLPVPDTAPGEQCQIMVPGRAQYFRNLAVISYVMTRADCTPCLPGRLDCFIDTRQPGQVDRTFPVPGSLPSSNPPGLV